MIKDKTNRPFRACKAKGRRGYAERLARAAFAEISRQGASNIQLDVLAHNEQGLAFWSKLGFTLHHYVLERPASG